MKRRLVALLCVFLLFGIIACDDESETFNTCGDNALDNGEVCDGTALENTTCESLGYGEGTLSCLSDCSGFDTSECGPAPECGDGEITGDEVCDGTALEDTTCESLGYGEGTLSCLSDCSGFDTSECGSDPECGDGEITGDEVCDGTSLDGNDCTTIGMGFTGGTLACNSECDGWDTTSCESDDFAFGTSYDPEIIDDYEISSSAYYVDPVNGSDDNDGSEEAPFATLYYALSQMSGGEIIYLNDGEYGDMDFGAVNFEDSDKKIPIEEVFTDWVTVKAINKHDAIVGNLQIGTWHTDTGWGEIPFSQLGNSDLRLRLDGVRVEAIKIYGSRYVDIRNCLITRSIDFEDLNDSEKGSFIEAAGIKVINGRYVHLYNNEITNSGLGVYGMTTDFVAKNNHIHHNMHDGFQIHGGSNWLIEGNIIHDLDDGAADGNDISYNIHADGIHMYTIAAYEKYAQDAKNVTIRGNFFYHIEAMDVMINAAKNDGIYSNFLWENNLFAPSNGYMFITYGYFEDSLIFRNNTVLYTPNDQWTSHLGRDFGSEFGSPTGDSYCIQFYGDEFENSHYQFYNNILSNRNSFVQGEWVNQKNIFYTGDTDEELDDGAGYKVKELPYLEMSGALQDFVDQGNIPGTLVDGSPAIDNGYVDTPAITEDYNGDARDSSPDIGALEY